MVGLMDIGESISSVTIRGSELSIVGVTAHGLLVLFGRFPELRKAYEERKAGGTIDAAVIVKLAPTIVTAVIAFGTGNENNPAAEEKAATFSVGEQMSILTAIFKATFPQGVRPFVDELAALSSGGISSLVAAANVGTAPDGTSPSRLNGSSA